MLFDNYTLQRVVNHESGQGWLVLCDKEGTELSRCVMPIEVLGFYRKRSRIEREVLQLPVDEQMEVQLETWSDLEGKPAGRLSFQDGSQRNLTEKELRAILRLDQQQKRVAVLERKLLGELIGGYIATLPVDETEETTNHAIAQESLQ